MGVESVRRLRGRLRQNSELTLSVTPNLGGSIALLPLRDPSSLCALCGKDSVWNLGMIFWVSFLETSPT